MKNNEKTEYSGKVVLITGGNSGIGKETAIKFLEQSAIVYILGRDKVTLQKTKEELENMQGSINTISANISDSDECKITIDEIIKSEGKLDILVNSAGVCVEGPIDEMSSEDFDNVINTNLKGTYFMCKYAKPILAKTKGCIINIGSTAGITGFDQNSLYCASKGGMNLLTKALAVELAKDGIRVNIINPDMVQTRMLDVGFDRSDVNNRSEYIKMQLEKHPQSIEDSRFILPEEVAECVLFFASSGKAQAITGAGLTIDFGLTAGLF